MARSRQHPDSRLRKNLEDDHLPTPEVGVWALEKYRLLQTFGEIFNGAMASKWERRVYLDPFAGPGRSRIDGFCIVETSPMIALRLDPGFTHYVFGDEHPKTVDALRERVEREALGHQVQIQYVSASFHDSVRAYRANIPPDGLTVCFLDPFNIGALHFEDIRVLTENRKVDLLILLATGMDLDRNKEQYMASTGPVDDLLGVARWREKWLAVSQRDPHPGSFGRFIVREFIDRMRSLGYIPPGDGQMKSVKDGPRMLYVLAYFSRHKQGLALWEQALKYSSPKLRLPGF